MAWGPEYEDRRLSYGSLGVGSLERDLKSTLQTLECLSGSEPDLTPHDSSDDEDEVMSHYETVCTEKIKCGFANPSNYDRVADRIQVEPKRFR